MQNALFDRFSITSVSNIEGDTGIEAVWVCSIVAWGPDSPVGQDGPRSDDVQREAVCSRRADGCGVIHAHRSEPSGAVPTNCRSTQT